MENRERREALRGAEIQTFDLLAQVLTADQWAELLRAPLERAAAEGNRGFAQKLAGAGAEIGDALHAAAGGGHGDVVNDLLENGASVAAKNTEGSTPLHMAAKEGETEMVQLLLLKGAEKDALDTSDWTPLCVAAWYDRVAAALALLAAGADVSLRCGGYKGSVVHLAAEGGQVDIMRAAMERGADVHAVDGNQETPLHRAACHNRVEAISVLVKAGANIQAGGDEGYAPLHYAAFYAAYTSLLEAVLALLKHGANVNARDQHQRTPLHLAAGIAGERGATEMVDLLLRSGADETILNDKGEAAADVVAEYVEESDQVTEDVELVRELLANAPSDRAWRRRGYLVLCRAHPDRMRQMQDMSGACAGVARTTRSNAKMARTEADSCTGITGDSTVGGQAGGDWASVVARVLVLQEEGIFRTIVGYL